ncbi:hypothetical protein PY093_06690 [Cytobacillus sp. S13-E01]|uniref:hypothetical protein n=1 Tax=Cytobacillus sp. S13-E01 TaxID=3031326 RepID=UPI0023D86C6E|nr:hypothetical protein [Cytobacillus sp. S13-E01]MDF0726400.1 hypothetical protein [Cytobacillus sp. S13-E01]
MNIYTKFAKYIVSSLKAQRQLSIQESDLRFIKKEILDLEATVRKANEPGWLIVSLD